MSCKEFRPRRVKFARAVLELSSVIVDEIDNPFSQVGSTFGGDDVYSFNPVTIDTEIRIDALSQCNHISILPPKVPETAICLVR